MKASATELNKHPGKYLNQAIKEPVIIERAGHPTAVLVSYERYMQLEDAFWVNWQSLQTKRNQSARRQPWIFCAVIIDAFT